MTYGWFPMGDFMNTNCIVLFGHITQKNSLDTDLQYD